MLNGDKHEFPLIVLEEIKAFKSEIEPPFYLESPNQNMVHVIDSRAPGKAYFIIKEYAVTGGKSQYKVRYKPSSRVTTQANEGQFALTGVGTVYEKWVGLCNQYDTAEHPITTPEERKVEDEIFSDWRILDDDADTTAFSIPTQLYLTEAIERIKSNIKQADEEVLSDVQKQQLCDTITAIQEDIPQETKNGVFRKLANWVAKAGRGGIKVRNFVIKEVTKEIIKEGVKVLFKMDVHTVRNWLINFGDDVKGLIEGV